MSHFIAFFVKLFSHIARRLPRRAQLLIGDGLGWFVFGVIRLRRKMMDDHLQLAFPDWTEVQRRQVALRSLQHSGRSLIEYFTLPSIDRSWVDQNVTFTGWEHYEAAKKSDRGILMLTLHVGNGDLALAVLALMGLRVGIVSKRFKSKELNDVWFGLRKKDGLEIIPEEKSSYQILKFLKQRGCVVFVLDQFMGPPVGVPTTFFGKETGTAAGLALFAERSGAPVLPAYTYRERDGKTHLVFEAPHLASEIDESDRDKKIVRLTQHYTDIIEGIVRRHPDQWLWLHRRWKTFEVR